MSSSDDDGDDLRPENSKGYGYDGSSSDEEEEELDEELARKELAGWLVEEENEGEKSDASSENDSKEKSHEASSDDECLDEEDFQLIKENFGINIQKKKKCRLVIESDEENEDEVSVSDSRASSKKSAAVKRKPSSETSGVHPDVSKRRKDIAREIFSDDEDDDEFVTPAVPAKRSKTQSKDTASVSRDRIPSLPTFPVPDDDDEEGSDDDEDDINDFIVNERGIPHSKRAKKKKHVFYDSQLQQAHDIFGVDINFEELNKMGTFEEGDEFVEEEVSESEESDEESERSSRRSSARGAHKRQRQRMVDIAEMNEFFDPREIERGFFAKDDQLIRELDMPERFQTRHIPVHWIREEDKDYEQEMTELEEEANWIYLQAFQRGGGCITAQEYDQNDSESTIASYFVPTKARDVIPQIKFVLEFFHKNLLEVPFIAFYRKEFVEQALDINDLWQIYIWDEKWWALRERRKKLLDLMERMRSYLRYRLTLEENVTTKMEPSVLPVDGGMLDLLENDIAMCRYADCPEEIHDLQQHFHLTFGDDMPGLLMWEHRVKLSKKGKIKSELNDDTSSIADSRAETIEGEDEDDDTFQERLKKVHQVRKRVGGPLYAAGKRAGLLMLVEQFGLSAANFGVNLRDQYQRYEVTQYAFLPLAASADYISQPIFPTEAAVLQAARLMLACQIAHDPNVVKSVRKAYEERAKINICPTKKGRDEIDESHPLYTVKYIRDKPLTDLKGEMFLHIDKAQREKLITYTIDMEMKGSQDLRTYFDEIQTFFQKDEYSEVAKAWNEQRSMVIRLALEKFLYPKLLKEMRSKLLRESYDGITKICRRKMFNWLKVAPYPSEDANGAFDENDDVRGQSGSRGRGMCARVMSIAYEEVVDSRRPGSEYVIYAAMLDSWGMVGEYIKFNNLLRSANSARKEHKDARNIDVERLKQFILKNVPTVVCVAAESRSALYLQETLKNLLNEMDTEHLISQPIPVHLMDNEAAIVYALSHFATTQFPDYPKILLQAIALGRRLQDPMLELAQLFNFEKDILNLRMHPLQDDIPKDMLLQAIEIEFVNRVNEVGVDVNRCLEFPHTSCVMQFVAGLGPRKGLAVLKSIESRQRFLYSRMELVDKGKLTLHVTINCAAFIKIDPTTLFHFADLPDSSEAQTALDRTRIHPESYRLAGKMAIDAMDTEEQDFNGESHTAIDEIMQSPEKLRELDLDAFAEELKRQNHGDKRTTLYDIRMELTHCYKDFRQPYRPPNAEERFHLITKETPTTFHVGLMVNCQILRVVRRPPKPDQLESTQPLRSEVTGLWVCPFCQQDDFTELSNMWSHFDAEECPGEPVGLHCILENGVTGFLPTRFLSDSKVSNIYERVEIGMSIITRIVKIDIEKFRVDLTSRSSDLKDEMDRYRSSRDTYYDYDTESRDVAEVQAKMKKRTGPRYAQRMIFHPMYKNISYSQFVKMIKSMAAGEMVIRPSSKGVDHLTVSWKVDDNNIVQHIDVLELEKPNSFTLGRILRINDEDYEDLDEIIARYVQPMANYAREIMDYRYYSDTNGGQKETMQGILHREKAANRARIPYFLTACKQLPGKFILFYLPQTRMRTEYITLTPSGLRFRERMFDSIQRLLDWFKVNYNNV